MSLERHNPALRILAATSIITLSYGFGRAHQYNADAERHQRQQNLNAIVADYARACEMQAEAAVTRGGISGILPTWEELEKIIRDQGRLLINLPSGSVPPQELHFDTSTASFTETLAAISNQYLQANNFADQNSRVVHALQCNTRGGVSLVLSQPLTAHTRPNAATTFHAAE